MLEYVFKKIADMPTTSLKRGPSTGFPVKFVKFLKKPLFTEHLQWMLLALRLFLSYKPLKIYRHWLDKHG